MRLNPVLEQVGTYPFVRLNQAKRATAARGVDLIDFGVGEPREETPAFIRRAVVDALEAEPVSAYPLAEGLPELRAAAAGWVRRRFGAVLEPDDEVIPTLGAKEAIFHLAQVVGRPGDAVGVTTPGYPVPARGAAFAGLDVVELALTPERGWLPDLDAVPWERLAVLWLNSPNNPTAVSAPLDFLERAAERCRAHDVVLASDEAYCELWFAGEPPASALQVADRSGVVAFHTLSKRSSMPGYRCGFAAGDRELIGALRRYRPTVGTAPPTFLQRAAAVAWSDDDHVAEIRAGYASKRRALLPALEQAGLQPAGGDATFFLWLGVPGGDDQALAADWLERGVVVAPGSLLGPGGAGHVRVALVPTLARCQEAAERLTGARAARR